MGGGKAFFGPDAYALSVPIAAATTLFFAMIGRAFVFDPEWSSGMAFYEKEEEAKKIGENYRMQYMQMFMNRIRHHKMSVFNNDPK